MWFRTKQMGLGVKLKKLKEKKKSVQIKIISDILTEN